MPSAPPELLVLGFETKLKLPKVDLETALDTQGAIILCGDPALLPTLVAHHIRVLQVSTTPTIEEAVWAMGEGATGYLKAPIDRAALKAQLARIKGGSRQHLSEETQLGGILGASKGMRRVFEIIERVAPTTLTVAVFGESGTGKELVAQAVHDLSPRKNQSFLAINCASLPEQLLQSELFGYKRGAFTGAVRDREGLFKQAHKGTLFLDEIGDLAPSTQVALLRVLQEGEVLPIGGRKPVKVDVRVIVATHRNLQEQVDEGHFREDLMYRVNVAAIQIPPLRSREGDIDLLADHFLGKFSQHHQRPRVHFDPDARQALHTYPWPGNVRELQHAVERAVVMGDHDAIQVEDLFPGGLNKRLEASATIRPLKEAREEWEKGYLTRLLESTAGNISAAARASGKYRADLYQMLSKHNIDPAEFKREGD